MTARLSVAADTPGYAPANPSDEAEDPMIESPVPQPPAPSVGSLVARVLDEGSADY
jgi:hypothetical protein